MKTKILAFYLPQYHPTPENDEWWGKGFTEWSNVAKTTPRFKGHHQPHLPADLGFYDLRLDEVRKAQAVMAIDFLVSGFCYYHYWFNGKLLLERPLEEVINSGSPDFPFCLCWANENWTRAWDGLDKQSLVSQEYSTSDNKNHIEWLTKRFKDARYIKIQGSPVLLIYRPDSIPNAEELLLSWRNHVKNAGFPGLYVCAVKNSFVQVDDHDLISKGYDAVVDFQPNRADFPRPNNFLNLMFEFARRFLPKGLYQLLKLSGNAAKKISYTAMVDALLKKPWPSSYKKFPCIFPSWDNSARRKTSTIIQNDSPKTYGKWLKNSLENVANYPEEERIVFINAWNEWAEGCHLEPDKKNGYKFLNETKKVVTNFNSNEELINSNQVDRNAK